MGKHLLTRDERIEKARKWRKYVNRRHHIEAKQTAKREEQILKHLNIRNG